MKARKFSDRARRLRYGTGPDQTASTVLDHGARRSFPDIPNARRDQTSFLCPVKAYAEFLQNYRFQ